MHKTAGDPTGRPISLDHKFITEDVPTGLIPMNALEAAAQVRTPELMLSSRSCET